MLWNGITANISRTHWAGGGGGGGGGRIREGALIRGFMVF